MSDDINGDKKPEQKPLNPMIAMVLKNIGLKPDELKAQIDGAAKRFNMVLEHFNKRFDVIDAKLDLLQKQITLNAPIQKTPEKTDEAS